MSLKTNKMDSWLDTSAIVAALSFLVGFTSVAYVIIEQLKGTL